MCYRIGHIRRECRTDPTVRRMPSLRARRERVRHHLCGQTPTGDKSSRKCCSTTPYGHQRGYHPSQCHDTELETDSPGMVSANSEQTVPSRQRRKVVQRCIRQATHFNDYVPTCCSRCLEGQERRGRWRQAEPDHPYSETPQSDHVMNGVTNVGLASPPLSVATINGQRTGSSQKSRFCCRSRDENII